MIRKMWLDRKKRLLKLLARNLKYLVNDSLISIVILIFILFSYYLPRVIDQLFLVDKFLMELIILLLSYSIISSQRMFTFIKEADLYFLLTKEIAVVNQLKKSVIQSLLTILFQIFKFLTIYFFLFFISKNPTALFVILFVVILLSIAIKNYITWHEFYGKKIAFSPMLNSLVYIISIYLTLSKNYFLDLILLISYFLFLYFKLNYISEKNLNWNLILFYEQTSFSMFNKFLSNFLLIKESKLNISSPKYLNKILDLIPKNNDYLVAYIYFRRVLRVKDNRKELFSVPFIILFISISVSPSILSILIPLLIFITTTITLSKKCSLRTFPMLIITKRHINRLIFCLVFLEFSLFIPIFFYLILTQCAYIYILTSVLITALFLKYHLKI